MADIVPDDIVGIRRKSGGDVVRVVPREVLVDEIIDFKVAGEKGIIAGKIKSIIHPALADLVRREAVRFKDELVRAV